ncbi:hypothetical protein PGTUg99_003773, partial [Puccinia graminis f. sp. tritici]
MAQSSKLTTGLFFHLAGVVDQCLGVGWGEETLFLLPRRSRRSTPISTPPTDSPPTQLPKPTINHPNMSNPTIPAQPTKALAPPKDAANGLQPPIDAAKVPAAKAAAKVLKDPAEAAANGQRRGLLQQATAVK